MSCEVTEQLYDNDFVDSFYFIYFNVTINIINIFIESADLWCIHKYKLNLTKNVLIADWIDEGALDSNRGNNQKYL